MGYLIIVSAAREHFIKSEVVQLNQNGDYSLRYYVLDPSKIHDVSSGDLGNTQVTNVYTLVYEKDFNQDRTDNLTDLGGTRRVESQNKDYFLNVTPRRIDEQHLELDITGWFSTKETVTYTDEKTGIEYTVPKPINQYHLLLSENDTVRICLTIAKFLDFSVYLRE